MLIAALLIINSLFIYVPDTCQIPRYRMFVGRFYSIATNVVFTRSDEVLANDR